MSTKSKTPSVVSATGALLEIVVTLVAMVKKMGGEIGECFYLLSRKENEGELEQIAARMVELYKRAKLAGLLVGAKKLTLKFVADGITVKVDSFAKSSFFVNEGSVKLYFGSNFANWVLSVIPKAVPAFEGMLTQNQLVKSMSDSEILSELVEPKPFTPAEFAAIVRHLVSRQPKGEGGTLLANGYANIFYVQLEDERVVAVSVGWGSDVRDWSLGARGLGDGGWGVGRCVFSRS